MIYQFQSIEKKWQDVWAKNKIFAAEENSTKPKYFVLDMFPYPSGAGLHVGHPLGYVASDIVSRYKRNQGFNVLHPMGWDAFGLPAEQYAIQTGQHPALTTEKNIETYRRQLDRIGLSFDWTREISTCDPAYYKWTQWAFSEMFAHYYDTHLNKAMPVSQLVDHFTAKGNSEVHAHCGEVASFSAADWKGFTLAQREEILGNYRIAYLADLPVNWCAALGTVLANDEVKDGLSVRGAHPVEQKIMKQWSLRISAYADRLLAGLDALVWSDSIKEMQRNWIGKSQGAEVDFKISARPESLRIFTTRPDTIFGVSFMVLAPESEWCAKLTTSAQKSAVDQYLMDCLKRTERDRISDAKTVSGVFTGSYVIHPFTGKEIPIWIGDYVLGGYGTGAIMAVPAHDTRDYAFARHFSLPVLPVVEGGNIEMEAYEAKDGIAINSDFLNGLPTVKAIARAIEEIEKRNLGVHKTNFRLRDAIFSRQRYWGEPFPVYYENGIAKMIPLKDLPVALPAVDKYLPTETGEPPLARAKSWSYQGHPIEYSTMPGFAGSSAYYFRYMDPKNPTALADAKALQYWKDVDLYVGGSEHATGHLIYSRFWCKFLYDIGLAPVQEPFKKLVNQGFIQGRSNYVYRLKKDPNTFVSAGLKIDDEVQAIHVDVTLVQNDFLDVERFKQWRAEFGSAKFILEDASGGEKKYRCGWAVEKMSKSFYNVVNPDRVCEEYGADTFRLFEMFLGPLEQNKPWNTSGIDGVHRFLLKSWRWIHGENGATATDTAPVAMEHLRLLHQTIEKITKDIEALAFNTCVSQLMICVNEFSAAKIQNKGFIEQFLVLLSPFAPHFSEELWAELGHQESISRAPWPKAREDYLVSDSMHIAVQVNGKIRDEFDCSVLLTQDEVFALVLARAEIVKHTQGKEIKKKIYVPKKLVNLVVV